MNHRRRIISLFAAILLVVPLSACAMGSGSRAIPDLRTAEEPSSEAASGFDASAEADASLDPMQNLASASARAGKSIISTGDLSVTVSDPEDAATQVAEITNELGGSVESQSISAASDGRPANATLAIRVPADKVDEAFAKLAEVGTVTSQNRSSTDVTTEHVDLRARVAALKESVDRLTELMSGAASTSELIEAESALSQRQQELDGLTAQLKSLEGQVDDATIWVSLSTQSVLPGGPTNFWDGLIAGLDSMATAGAGALVVAGILLPWLALGGVIALIVILIVRAAKRRSGRPAHSEQLAHSAQTAQLAHPDETGSQPTTSPHDPERSGPSR